jgi:hypothetical protein
MRFSSDARWPQWRDLLRVNCALNESRNVLKAPPYIRASSTSQKTSTMDDILTIETRLHELLETNALQLGYGCWGEDSNRGKLNAFAQP